ncbi:MAG: (2Fe-2S)-binding protein [Pseudomonadota bacterium]|nr:(2Fe-2S)-binding protein [Pseudomonadota bacterium]
MYICICNGITESHIRACVKDHGIRKLGQLRERLGTCNQCGKCAASAKETLERFVHDQQRPCVTLNLKTAGTLALA